MIGDDVVVDKPANNNSSGAPVRPNSGLHKNNNNMINMKWSMDSHVLEKIYMESPCNPIMHVGVCVCVCGHLSA